MGVYVQCHCLLLPFFFCFHSYSREVSSLKAPVEKLLKEKNIFTRSNLNYVLAGKVIANSKVENLPKKKQKMRTTVAAVHSKKCEPVIEKLAKYEEYSSYMGFVKKSVYKNGEFDISLQVSVFPINFDAKIKIDRLKDPGVYPYTMSAGFLKGLKGKLIISEHDKKCSVFSEVDWEGKDTGYNTFLMENFFTTIAKSGLEKLFSLSGHRQ
jgi:predicted transcriptional regulator